MERCPLDCWWGIDCGRNRRRRSYPVRRRRRASAYPTGDDGGIAVVYDIDIDKATIAATAATAVAAGAGRAAVGGLLKLIPGVGWLAGGAINAAVAGGFTMAMGTAWALV